VTKDELLKRMLEEGINPQSLDLHYSPNKQKAYVVTISETTHFGKTDRIESQLSNYSKIKKAQSFIEEYKLMVKKSLKV